MAHDTKQHPGLLKSVITNKCPRCRRGDLFIDANPYHLSRMSAMPEHCPVCGLKYERQTGFFFGTGYVSYALAVAVSFVTLAIWWLTIGLSYNDNSVIRWLVADAVVLLLLQPVLQRLSRSIWIAFFVRYDPQWDALTE